jgi:hypothetical protein
MTVTEIAEEVQAQLLSAMEVVQNGVVSTIEWVGEQAEARVPEAATRLTERLPLATHYVNVGFDTAEQWLRSNRDFASKVAGALQPQRQATA